MVGAENHSIWMADVYGKLPFSVTRQQVQTFRSTRRNHRESLSVLQNSHSEHYGLCPSPVVSAQLAY